MILRFHLSTILLIFSLSLYSKVDPPNYDFSLKALDVFSPGKNFTEVEKKYGKGEIVEKSADGKILKFYIAQPRYKFPVFLQTKNKKNISFFARLPTYFLHDIFHQSLINRYGKQDKYYKQETNALYIWNNIGGVKYFYSGTCTITCFPIYYAGEDIKAVTGGQKSLLKKFMIPLK